MNVNVFFDSNILIYLYSKTEIEKKLTATALLNTHDTIFISTQVCNELVNVLHKKFKISFVLIQTVLNEILSTTVLSIVNYSIIEKALSIASKYQYYYYDSLINSFCIGK